MKVAVIPARGGSKRIPRKNIRDFRGKPIIAYSVAAARESRLFDRILISTDDREIADIAEAHGAEIPFLRPADLADDFTGTTEVIAHATQWMLDQGWSVEFVCCIYPTAPFVQADDLSHGLSELQAGAWHYAFTATEYASPIFRSFKRHPDGGVEMLFPEQFTTRSQDLPVALHDAGQFYWGRSEVWMSRELLFDRHSIPILIPRWRVHDIDTEDDWRRAELIHRALVEGNLGLS